MAINHHTYTDISHFRAPYKNWISLGAEATPPGQAAPMIPAGIPPQQAAFLVADPDGSLALKPELQTLLLPQMQGHVIIVFDDNQVKLAVPLPVGEMREYAIAWINRKLGEGKVIVAGTTAGVSGLALPTGTVDKMLMAVSPGEAKKITEQGLFGVLVRPSAGQLKAGVMGPLGVAVLVLGGAAIAYAIWGKKKQRGGSASRTALRI